MEKIDQGKLLAIPELKDFVKALSGQGPYALQWQTEPQAVLLKLLEVAFARFRPSEKMWIAEFELQHDCTVPRVCNSSLELSQVIVDLLYGETVESTDGEMDAMEAFIELEGEPTVESLEKRGFEPFELTCVEGVFRFRRVK